MLGVPPLGDSSASPLPFRAGVSGCRCSVATGFPIRKPVARAATSDSMNMPIAVSGAVNRPGANTPTANPTPHTDVSAAAPTATGHQSGPPHVAWPAVTPNSTPTNARYAVSTQPTVAARARTCRLTEDELDARVDQASASRSRAELAALTADLPAGLVTVRPPQASDVWTGVGAIMAAVGVIVAILLTSP